MFPIKDVSDVERSFGANNMAEMMPSYSQIPEEFKDFNGRNKWNVLVRDMFFFGLKSIDLTPKKGVDPKKAFKHIRSIMVSWIPKHEHKEAACAFLFNEWFEDVKYEANEKGN